MNGFVTESVINIDDYGDFGTHDAFQMDENDSLPKRTPTDNVHFKILVPSIAAGAIIGKGGEAIAQIQKDTGAKVKMSKANDFYPGTTERVCLMQGSVDSISAVHNYIMDKILEKPDPNPSPNRDGRLNVERHKQVKILVPNSTAGMIIGKKGAYIKEIMDKSGAYVQISQKPKDQTLAERCVTVAGEPEANKVASSLIVAKIAEDPQSASCPNISYTDVSGPVASAFPTGSPFAVASASSSLPTPTGSQTGGTPGLGGAQATPLSLNSSTNSTCSFTSISMETLRASLRQSGFSELAAEEIITAMMTLANYGFFNIQSLVSTPALLSTPSNPTPVPMLPSSPQTSFNLPPGSLSTLTGQLTDAHGSSGADFGPFSQTGDHQLFYPSTQPTFEAYPSATPPNPFAHDSDKMGIYKQELDIPESLVGVIIGPGGKDIVDLQSSTQTNIQISKRGDYLPQTRNRIVTITGAQINVQKAANIIQKKVEQENQRRQHSGTPKHM